MANVCIRFERSCSPYCPGDEAMFDEAAAATYVKKGVAFYVTAEISVAPVTKVLVPPSPSSNHEILVEPEKEPVKKKKKKRIFSRVKKKAEE